MNANVTVLVLGIVRKFEGYSSSTTALRVLHLCSGRLARDGVLAGTHVRDLIVTFYVGIFVTGNLQLGNGELLIFRTRDAWGALLVFAD